MNILLVEDDPILATTLRRSLEREGFAVRHAARGEEALELASAWSPDLVLLDVGLPDLSGTEVARRLRLESETPIIMVTAQGSTDDRIEGLDGGADDYVVKPFVTSELLARIRAVVRRAQRTGPPGSTIVVRDLEVDTVSRSARLRGTPLDLKEREYELLRLLVARAGQIVRRDEITRALWGLSPSQAANSLHVHMSWLRSKLGDDPRSPRYIETVHGRGFRFLADAPAAAV